MPRNKEAAYKLIDYLNRPEVAASNSVFIQYAPRRTSRHRSTSRRRFSRSRNLSERGNAHAALHHHAYDEKTQRVVNRLWTRGEDRPMIRLPHGRLPAS